MTGAGAELLAALRDPGVAALPSTLVVVAHPDDETVGAGSRLRRLAQARFAYVTDGAPRDGADASRHGLTTAQYAQAREREIEAVLARCGVAANQIVRLGCPDQQASLQLADLTRRLADVIARLQVELVLTQAYEGGHPDHDATAFVAHAAVALLRARGEPAPEIVEMAGYRRGPEGLLASHFLPRPEVDDQMLTVRLTPEEREFKRGLIAAFSTQQQTLQQFALEIECFRPAPRYDFTQPPHDGALHYENFPWGMTGARFRQLAGDALSQLGLQGPL